MHADAWWKESRSLKVGARPEAVVSATESAFESLDIDLREQRANAQEGRVEGRTSHRGRVSVTVRAAGSAASELAVRIDFEQEGALDRICAAILAGL